MGKLYVVPTPVGNLEDMTFRAIRILKEADLILAEDTRTSGILLKHFEIKNAMQSYHKFNEHKTVEGIINRLKAGETIALVSDAGTPGISDPGFLVVRECVKNDIEVQCLPGATAFVPALVASGLPDERFCFEGSNRKQNYLGENKNNRLILLTDEFYPRLEVIFGGHDSFREPLEIDADEFIAVKGFKAKGKRINNYTVETINQLEPPRLTEQEHEPQEYASEDPSNLDPDSDKSEGDIIDEITGQMKLF